MSAVAIPMIAGLGTTELLIILGVLILLFGAKKLPELARGSGRALRIFKSETKGLMDDDEDDGDKTPEQREIDARDREDREREARRAAESPVEQHHPDTDR